MNEFEYQVPQDKKRIIIDSTLANPSGNMCIRRVLSGFDNHPTEQEVAELVGPFDEKGVPPRELLKALQHYNTGYSYTQAILTIGEIKELTKDGSRVLIHTRNERNVDCFMVIEKVSGNENDESSILTIYDPSDPKDQRIRNVPYSKLKPFLSGHNLVPPKKD